MFPRGQIIAFEGLDCSFKETNFNRYIEYLRNKYYNECKNGLIAESFPRYGHNSCYMIDQFLYNKMDSCKLRANYSDAICSLYSIDRLHFWNEFHPYTKIQLTYMDISKLPYSCFVFDRYSLSNAIYNPDNGEYVTKQDIIKEKERFGNPLPTILVFLHMNDRRTYLDILSKKSDKDFNESNINFMATVWDRTEALINSGILQECGISLLVIECLDDKHKIRSREEIFDNILHEINNAIDLREISINYPFKKENSLSDSDSSTFQLSEGIIPCKVEIYEEDK